MDKDVRKAMSVLTQLLYRNEKDHKEIFGYMIEMTDKYERKQVSMELKRQRRKINAFKAALDKISSI